MPYAPGERQAVLRSGGQLVYVEQGEVSQITSFRSPELFSSFGLPRAMDPEGSADL